MDCILAGHAVREQKALFGHRLVGHLVYNFMAEKALTAHEFLPLPALDAAPAPVAAGPDPDFMSRIAARLAASSPAPSPVTD